MEYEAEIANGKRSNYETGYKLYFDKSEREKIEKQTSFIIHSTVIGISGIIPSILRVRIMLDMYNAIDVYLKSEVNLTDYAPQLRLNKEFRAILKFVIYLKRNLKPYLSLNQ